MAKVMVTGSYTEAGIKLIMQQGGSARFETVRKLAAAAGATIEAMYFVYGKDDFVVILDGPDTLSAAAAVMVAASTGISHPHTTILMTAEEMDQAAAKARAIASNM